MHRLANAERYRDQIAQQRHPDSERDRNRELFFDQLQHADIAEIALAEIEAHIVPQHDEEALVSRLVEAELLLEALDEGGVEALRAAIFGIHFGRCAAGSTTTRAEIAAGGAGYPRGGAGIGPRELRDNALHRSTRRELYHHERDQHDPENRGNHEQDAAGDVGGHNGFMGPVLSLLI